MMAILQNRYGIENFILANMLSFCEECPTLTTKTLLCGCVYEENEWMLVRIKECEKHYKERHKKVEYRPKAECNRNDTRGE
jgi:hypothetical protein